jgi:uncharacterized damage-inducible protein DinB
MKAEEILEEVDNSRERLLMALEALPDEALAAPGAMGEWSIADLLVHLVAWESELVTALLRLDQGKRPVALLDAIANMDAYNARVFTENRGRDLDRIFGDLQGVRLQLEQWLDAFSEHDLNDPNRYSWTDGLPLWRIIRENSYGHELEHLPAIEAFAATWLAANESQTE